ncbi:MAG: RNA methyltransferase [Odoribacteraceae bacterium]|jgi:TrmH family RNA methyltransferase|nr:RNA methyltransferase [Odoribacteraceae bacterium]
MLSKHLTNVVQNLEKRKFREKYRLFKVEGEKLVEELSRSGLRIDTLIARPEWLEEESKRRPEGCTVVEVSGQEMARLSSFKSPPGVIALAEIPDDKEVSAPADALSVVLNGVQDPGNLGTILRVCDWFDVRFVFCDRDCAGYLNPKSVQASMGAIFRVNVAYVDLAGFIPAYASEEFPCYGTFLDGESIHESELGQRGFIVMGNEGGGISAEIERLVTRRLTIPRYSVAAESLNVGVATGIVLSEFKRQQNRI